MIASINYNQAGGTITRHVNNTTINNSSVTLLVSDEFNFHPN
jgi:hypothetical protein